MPGTGGARVPGLCPQPCHRLSTWPWACPFPVASLCPHWHGSGPLGTSALCVASLLLVNCQRLHLVPIMVVSEPLAWGRWLP